MKRGQRAIIHLFEVATSALRTVHESTTTLFEAPNWTRDGRLIVNADGLLWQLSANAGFAPEPIDITGLPPLNNDHVLSPVDDTIFVSADDFQLYRAPLGGGGAWRITTDDDAAHFLHGVSPDGTEIAYVRLGTDEDRPVMHGSIRAIGSDGAGERVIFAGRGHSDGPEYSPDGQWIYFNTEHFDAERAQVARIRPDGGGLEQLTVDDRVNWFPHLAPVGGHAVYLSYPDGTQGHPADRSVKLMLVEDGRWAHARAIAEVTGGQGTINVNSWSPDGSAFAFIAYPAAS